MPKKLKWVDVKRREGLVGSDLEVDILQISVHRLHGCDQTQWFGTCHRLFIDDKTLGFPGSTLDEAKDELLNLVRDAIEKLNEALGRVSL